MFSFHIHNSSIQQFRSLTANSLTVRRSQSANKKGRNKNTFLGVLVAVMCFPFQFNSYWNVFLSLEFRRFRDIHSIYRNNNKDVRMWMLLLLPTLVPMFLTTCFTLFIVPCFIFYLHLVWVMVLGWFGSLFWSFTGVICVTFSFLREIATITYM